MDVGKQVFYCLDEEERRLLLERIEREKIRGAVSVTRFKGGYITRRYGMSGQGIEAVQMEIAQRVYMDEDSFAWDAARAAPLQALLRRMLEACLDS